MNIIQISDLHLFSNKGRVFQGVKPWNHFESILKMLRRDCQRLNPEFILISGDLAQDKNRETYQLIAEQLDSLNCSIHWVPGNHDNFLLSRDVFSNYSHFKTQRVLKKGHWQFIFLNSQWLGKNQGILSDGELLILEKTLKQDHQSFAFIGLHHQPVPVHSAWLDQYVIKNVYSFFEIIDQYANIKIIAHGHVHQAYYQKRKSIPYIACPAVAFQFTRNQDDFGLDPLMPGYRIFNLNADGTFKTQIRRLSYNASFIPDLESKGY